MTHIQHIHTCSDAWILRLFAFDFCTAVFTCNTATEHPLSFHLSATMKIFGTPFRFFSWVLSNCRFRKSIHYQTRVPESRWHRHAFFVVDVSSGKCMKEDTNSKDGCPLGYHSEACDCYWRRGTPARWRCGKGNNKGLDACCCSNIAPCHGDWLWRSMGMKINQLVTSIKGMTEGYENCSDGFKF